MAHAECRPLILPDASVFMRAASFAQIAVLLWSAAVSEAFPSANRTDVTRFTRPGNVQCSHRPLSLPAALRYVLFLRSIEHSAYRLRCHHPYRGITWRWHVLQGLSEDWKGRLSMARTRSTRQLAKLNKRGSVSQQ